MQAAARGVQLVLPTDVVVAERFAKDAPPRTVAADAIPDSWMVQSLFPASCTHVFRFCVLFCKYAGSSSFLAVCCPKQLVLADCLGMNVL